jgi:hypothetical protein
VIVEVEVIEPRFHVLADLTYVADSLGEKLQRFDIAIRSAFVVVGAPLLNLLRRALLESVLLTITFSRGEFGLQCFGS